MLLVVLHGAPGVGKLTVAKELQALTGYRLFHNHLTVDLVASVFGFDSQAFRDVRERIWLDVLKAAARTEIEGVIFTLVFEPTVLPGFWDRLVTAVEGGGGTVRSFELLCSPQENARRVAQPDRRQYQKMTDAQSLLGAIEAHAFDPPEIAGNLRIDTTHRTPAETARTVYEALRRPLG
jgi:broad-specificity NMP kinase